MAGFSGGPRTYTLTCSNSNGSTSQVVTVEIAYIIDPPLDSTMMSMTNGSLAGTLVTQRSTYAIAGQTIAVRKVTLENGLAQSNELFYLYSDHPSASSGQALGSVSTIQNPDGTVEQARYLPLRQAQCRLFGGYRTTSTTNPSITDRGFTGQKHNNSLGLIYYNARFYVPGIGRFASADTIVPNPTNPQSLNRYSYVRNAPINMIDPTGHRECSSAYKACQPTPKIKSSSPFFNFIGEVTPQEMIMANHAARDIGQRMADEVNFIRRMEGKTQLSAAGAFKNVFGGPITMLNTERNLVDGGGFSVYAIASATKTMITIGIEAITNPQLFVHEIFHLFDLVVLDGAANQALWDVQRAPGSTFPNRPNLDGDSDLRWGFAGGNFSPWQKSRSGASGEEFADMGIGWTYGQWDTNALGVLTTDGQHRADFMSQHMSGWILQAMGQ